MNRWLNDPILTVDVPASFWENDFTFRARRISLAEYYIPVGEVVKSEPKSIGIETPRKKRPKELAVITECCTGCSGSPACVPYCPVADCMYWVLDEDHPPFGRIEVDPALCIGCKKCTSKGPDGSFQTAARGTPSRWYRRKKSSLISESSSRSNPWHATQLFPFADRSRMARAVASACWRTCSDIWGAPRANRSTSSRSCGWPTK